MVYWVDNPSAVAVKPKKDLVHSAVAKWFNDQIGVTPTIPRAEWFNMIQSEMLSIADALGVEPDKLNDAQLGAALKLVLVKVDGIPKLTDVLGTSKTLAASQFLVNTVNSKIPALSSTLSDNTTQAATPKLVNDVNRKVVIAQTTAENADAKAVAADKKATAADSKAAGAKVAADKAQQSADEAFKDRGGLGTIDLDTLGSAEKCGIYYQKDNTLANSTRHYPILLAGSLFVIMSRGVTQMYIPYDSKSVFLRNNYGGKWSNWNRLANELLQKTPRDVKNERVLETTYTNTTTGILIVTVSCAYLGGAERFPVNVKIDGVEIIPGLSTRSNTFQYVITAFVPPGSKYSVHCTEANFSSWVEQSI